MHVILKQNNSKLLKIIFKKIISIILFKVILPFCDYLNIKNN